MSLLLAQIPSAQPPHTQPTLPPAVTSPAAEPPTQPTCQAPWASAPAVQSPQPQPRSDDPGPLLAPGQAPALSCQDSPHCTLPNRCLHNCWGHSVALLLFFPPQHNCVSGMGSGNHSHFGRRVAGGVWPSPCPSPTRPPPPQAPSPSLDRGRLLQPLYKDQPESPQGHSAQQDPGVFSPGP